LTDADQPRQGPAGVLVSPPTAAEWQTFLNDLRHALTIENNETSNTSVSEEQRNQLSALQAVLAVLTLLETRQAAISHGLHLPLLRLSVALYDVMHGRQASLFRPTNRKQTRPEKAYGEALLIAHAALAAENLIEAGSSKDDACGKVARVIRSAKLPLPAGVSASLKSTIARWRDGLREGQGGRASPAALAIWEEYRRGESLSLMLPAVERAQIHLRLLQRGDAFHYR